MHAFHQHPECFEIFFFAIFRPTSRFAGRARCWSEKNVGNRIGCLVKNHHIKILHHIVIRKGTEPT